MSRQIVASGISISVLTSASAASAAASGAPSLPPPLPDLVLERQVADRSLGIPQPGDRPRTPPHFTFRLALPPSKNSSRQAARRCASTPSLHGRAPRASRLGAVAGPRPSTCPPTTVGRSGNPVSFRPFTVMSAIFALLYSVSNDPSARESEARGSCHNQWSMDYYEWSAGACERLAPSC